MIRLITGLIIISVISKCVRTLRSLYDKDSLHYAAACGNYTLIHQLTQKGENNFANHNGDTPLHLAAFYGHLRAVKYLVIMEGNSNILHCNSRRHSPVHEAIQQNHPEIVKYLVEKVGIESISRFRYSPLHKAAVDGNLPMVKLLLELRHKRIYPGISPIILAARGGHLDVVMFLMDDGKEQEESLLWRAMRHGLEVFTFIRKVKNWTLDSGMLERAVQLNDLELVKGLFELGLEVDTSETVISAITLAFDKDYDEIVRVILDAGSRVGVQFPFSTLKTEDETCTICISPCQVPMRLKCDHVFCFLCLISLRDHAKNSFTPGSISCPNCRKEYSKLLLKLVA